jgi:hypothetical protein
MSSDRERVQAHMRWIETCLRERHPTVREISWLREDQGYALRFTLDDARFGVGFKREYLEDEDTENLLRGILEGARLID